MARGPVYKDRNQVKDSALRVRVTPAMREQLQREADSRNLELSEWTRVKLGLEEVNQAAQPAPAGA